MQEIINYRKRGDSAFRAKDFTTAIHYYTQVCIYQEAAFAYSLPLDIYKLGGNCHYDSYMLIKGTR